MTNGWLLLGIVTVICIGDVLIGLRFYRMPAPQPEPGVRAMSARTAGLIFMLAGLVVWLIMAAMLTGQFGPVRNIQLIPLH